MDGQAIAALTPLPCAINEQFQISRIILHALVFFPVSFSPLRACRTLANLLSPIGTRGKAAEGAMANMRILAEGLRFPEGPVAMADGSIILTEIEAGRITRVTPDGQKQIIATPGGGPNGLAIGPEGKLYCCNNGGFNYVESNGMLAPHGIADDYSGGRIERIDITPTN